MSRLSYNVRKLHEYNFCVCVFYAHFSSYSVHFKIEIMKRDFYTEINRDRQIIIGEARAIEKQKLIEKCVSHLKHCDGCLFVCFFAVKHSYWIKYITVLENVCFFFKKKWMWKSNLTQSMLLKCFRSHSQCGCLLIISGQVHSLSCPLSSSVNLQNFPPNRYMPRMLFAAFYLVRLYGWYMYIV